MDRRIALALALSATLPCRAQLPVDTLKNVEVRTVRPGPQDEKRAYSPGMQRLAIDSATLARNSSQQLGTLLPQELPVFVKSYGFNSLATLQLRGASAAQTLVLWEGVPLANAALGVADLSTIPVSGLSGIELVYGSSAALFGSGNVGGALRISTSGLRDSAGSEISCFVGAGSFSQYTAGLRSAWTSGRWHAAISASGQRARNDFSYRSTSGEERRMPNNSSAFRNAAAAVRYDVSSKDAFTAQLWISESDRQLPPALFEQESRARLEATSLRSLLHWQHAGRTSWFAKVAALGEALRYTNPIISADNDNRSDVYFGEAGVSLSPRAGMEVLLSGSGQQSSLRGQAGQSQQRLALTASGAQSFLHQKLRLAVSLRGERVGENAFMLPGINAAYRARPSLLFRINAQKTYRVPTLNELYYSPGGNPDLRPEQGWHTDGGWVVTRQIGVLTLRHEAAAYYREIEDWVAWFGGSIWTPHNIASVRSSGLETENTLRFRQDSSTEWQLRIHLAYCASVTTSSYLPNDGSIGAQVPYAPRVLAGAGLSWAHGSFFAGYHHNYTGLRYITTDESAAVPAYFTGRLSIEYGWTLRRRTRLLLRATCNNIWNNRYQTIAGRPAPGRFGEISAEWRRN